MAGSFWKEERLVQGGQRFLAQTLGVKVLPDLAGDANNIQISAKCD